MSKKEFRTFQEEVEYDYHRKKKWQRRAAIARLCMLGVILLFVIWILFIFLR